jgi:hypothetical protein
MFIRLYGRVVVLPVRGDVLKIRQIRPGVGSVLKTSVRTSGYMK